MSPRHGGLLVERPDTSQLKGRAGGAHRVSVVGSVAIPPSTGNRMELWRWGNYETGIRPTERKVLFYTKNAEDFVFKPGTMSGIQTLSTQTRKRTASSAATLSARIRRMCGNSPR